MGSQDIVDFLRKFSIGNKREYATTNIRQLSWRGQERNELPVGNCTGNSIISW
jgi:hypothetical protein